jgi:homogentisate 1,2-dioxygenase
VNAPHHRTLAVKKFHKDVTLKPQPSANQAECADTHLRYLLGFGNEFATEALPGALPVGQNNPQRPPLGLVSELVSATAFVAPRAQNRRSYTFRIRPSANNFPVSPTSFPLFQTPPLANDPIPGAMRWTSLNDGGVDRDFLDGIVTICGNGTPKLQSGMAIHIYNLSKPMNGRAFTNGDAEMLVIPQSGGIRITTELGIMEIASGELALLPKGIKCKVDPLDGSAFGFVCENYGLPFVLPDLGLIGSHGLANAIDFEIPVAAFEDIDEPTELVHKFCGKFWATSLDYSPFDVVAWRGNWAPCKYNMLKFNTVGSVSYDHPDPSIFCALTSPSNAVGGGNVDFMILPPRWLVAEHSFRPPGYHRNAVAEFLALVKGAHESRKSSFTPGSMSLHNCWAPHGPDTETVVAAREAELIPQKIEDALIFMLETRFPLEMSAAALDTNNRQLNCTDGWAGFKKRFPLSD